MGFFKDKINEMKEDVKRNKELKDLMKDAMHEERKEHIKEQAEALIEVENERKIKQLKEGKKLSGFSGFIDSLPNPGLDKIVGEQKIK